MSSSHKRWEATTSLYIMKKGTQTTFLISFTSLEKSSYNTYIFFLLAQIQALNIDINFILGGHHDVWLRPELGKPNVTLTLLATFSCRASNLLLFEKFFAPKKKVVLLSAFLLNIISVV